MCSSALPLRSSQPMRPPGPPLLSLSFASPLPTPTHPSPPLSHVQLRAASEGHAMHPGGAGLVALSRLPPGQ
ncbi:unnamed protein product, partial [Closterium sp. NIES-54]